MKIIIKVLTYFLCLTSIFTACQPMKCPMTCYNEGICNGYHCICPTGYESYDCSVISRNNFLGAKTVGQRSGGYDSVVVIQYTAVIESDTTAIDAITISNFSNMQITVKGYVRGDTIILPEQQVQNSKVHGFGFLYPPTTFFVTIPHSAVYSKDIRMVCTITDASTNDSTRWSLDLHQQ